MDEESENSVTSIVVFMTTPTKREATRIVRKLLTNRLIACANIYGPVESHFWWQDKTERTREFLVLLKSNQRLFSKLTEVAKQMHSYDVPEIIAVPIVSGFQPYMDWLDATLGSSGER